MTAELRTYVTTRPTWEYRLWMGCLAASVAIIATAILPPTLWPWLIFGVTVGVAMGLGARCWQLRRTLAERDDELAHADAIIARLAAHAAEAPVPFVPTIPFVPGDRALWVVPPSPEVASSEWPAIARVLEIEEGE